MLQRLAPLRARLPMTVALLLAVCTGLVVTMAYRAVRESVTSASVERLHGAAERIAGLLEASARRLPSDAQRITTLPEVAAWLRGGASDPARARVDSLVRGPAQGNAVALIRRDGDSIVVGSASARAELPRTPVAGVGPFFGTGDTAGYSTAAPLVLGRDTLGRYVTVRRIGAANNGADLLAGMVGQGAAFRIGNADGSLWTDFLHVTPAPLPAAELASTEWRHATSDTLAATVRVPGTPWAIWIGQPTAIALQPATALVRRLSLLAVLVVLIGAAIAWWLLLRFTKPLDELAGASDAIARGDYGRRIARATTRDEVGRAAIAFNAMAAEIEAHHHELESLVRERTAELEHTLAELRLAQEEIVRKERLATLGQLAGGVGHELRNPLGVMTNALYFLEAVLPTTDAVVKDYFGILKNQIALSEKIVADLLDFARTKPPNRAPITIQEITRQQVERLGPLTSIRVATRLPAELPLVTVDSVQTGQVVFNLLMNAIQAMGEPGGELLITAEHDGNGSVTLEISDTGPGIPDDVAARIFEPLFTTKARGLGLGLCVSRMLAENNGGQLSFRTAVGTGTTFSLTMPAAT